MRRSKKFEIKHNSEFELDLAPLLAVMVKLVPVLLVSTAFVQTSVIESQLPQVVQQAIVDQDKKENATTITLYVGKQSGFEIQVVSKTKSDVIKVPNTETGFNYSELHQKLIAIKQTNPEVFKIDLRPEDNVSYNDLVKVLDETRAARDKNIKFPVTDKQTGKDHETSYMFPEVVFANMLEG